MTEKTEPVEQPEAMLFTKSEKKTDYAAINILYYGFPKTGKTTLASVHRTHDGREPLFVATEDGHSALEVYCQRVSSWSGFVRLCDHIAANGQKIARQHSCIVLDLVTDLDQWCAEAIAKKNGVTHISDMTFGKGFALCKQEFQTQLTKLNAILPITYIAHAGEREILWNGERLKVQAPSMSKGALEWVNGKCDAIAYVSPATSKREKAYLMFVPEKGTIAGTRFKQIAKSFEIDYANPQSTMAAIQTAFNSSVTQKETAK